MLNIKAGGKRKRCMRADCNCLVRPRSRRKGKIIWDTICCACWKEDKGYPANYKNFEQHTEFLTNKCERCSWDGPCDRHRIILGKNGGKYVHGNVLILCPNCHRLEHMKNGTWGATKRRTNGIADISTR